MGPWTAWTAQGRRGEWDDLRARLSSDGGPPESIGALAGETGDERAAGHARAARLAERATVGRRAGEGAEGAFSITRVVERSEDPPRRHIRL